MLPLNQGNIRYVALFHTSDQRFHICYIILCDVALLGVLQIPNCVTTFQQNVVQWYDFPLECD